MEVAKAETPTPSTFFEAATKKRKATEELDADHDARLRWKFAKELRLCDAWYMKRLNGSDVSKSRKNLAVSKSWVVEQVLPFFAASAAARVERGESERVIVHDCEQDSLHVLYLKKLKTGRFVFVGRWKDDFVIRRNLKKGDEIGLCWHGDKSMFSFTAFYRN
ncbi:B3 domain-containing protein At4g02870-like [Rosa rugosa]|uniref:B3 domain-containing protein At4g02870-like n=1 Tax=Rosa rugosa TaxID=74645 RepID=UPI002B40E912|nr:B3 domain-containing protein At4g02870-like [Rosa rugosa]